MYVAPILESSSSDHAHVINYTLGDILQSDNILLTMYTPEDTSIRSICNLMTPASPETTATIYVSGAIAGGLKPTDAFKTVVFKEGF